MNTQDEILSYLRSRIPRNHFEEIKDVVPIAFQKAYDAGNDLVHIPKDRKRAQDRYSFIQDGLAGLQKTWSSKVLPTNPRGEFYTLMNAENIRLTAAIKPWKKKLRPAKYRLNNSKLNKFLMSPQLELLDETGNFFDIENILNAIIIPLAPPPYTEQHRPLDIILAIPYFNSCSDYHVWCSLDKFILSYEEETTGSVDLAWPVIRKQMRRDEGLDESLGD